MTNLSFGLAIGLGIGHLAAGMDVPGWLVILAMFTTAVFGALTQEGGSI